MSKKENHKVDLVVLFDAYSHIGDAGGLTAYLISNSALPGRRANLELAAAFGDVVEDYAPTASDRLWVLCEGMTLISPDEAPTNSPEEFLPFCGTIGIGAIGSVAQNRFDAALNVLSKLANDARWRLREAVCFGLQKMLVKRGQDTLAALQAWVEGGDLLQMRAAAAAVAEPKLLSDEQMARSALQLHRRIFDQVLEAQESRSDEFLTLRKGLAYTLSVVVQATPQDGFAYMAELAQTRDSDVRWVVMQNLKKKRLTKNHPAEVEGIRQLLE